jgi:hypothetical protein
MSLLLLMIGIFMEEQELFQLPRAWCIFGHGQKSDPQINLLTQRAARVFQYLDVQLEVAFRALYPAEATHPYVEDRLSYPKVHSGSLALAYDKLGLRQVDYEHGDDEESDDEGEIGDNKSTERSAEK